MSRRSLTALLLPLALVAAACGTGATQAPVTFTPPTNPPSASPAPSDAPTDGPTDAPSAEPGATVEAADVGTLGTVLVAGSNQMTVYTFTKDVKDSGTSNCTGGCLATWPALTVAAGETPTAGPGVSGKLGTITRADDGSIQVTYDGLPLYFFVGDKAPGDGNGVYEDWEAVTP